MKTNLKMYVIYIYVCMHVCVYFLFFFTFFSRN